MTKKYLLLPIALFLGLISQPVSAQSPYFNNSLDAASVYSSVGQSEAGKNSVDKGELKRARRTFKADLQRPQVKSQRSKIFGDLCAVEYMMGNIDQALRHCDSAVKLSDGNWRAHNNRGVIHLLKAEYTSAQRDFTYALQLNPASRSVQRNLAEISLQNQREFVEN